MKKKVFIPIKRQSVRVPNKNFRDFDGKPLWVRLIDDGKFADCDVYIDTDAAEKFEHAELLNVGVYDRLPEHCGNEVSVNLLIERFINEHCDEDDLIVQVHTTTPFLNKELINATFDILEYGSYDSVVGCDVIQARCWREDYGYDSINYDYIPINHNPMKLLPTQDLNPILAENSAIYGFTPNSFNRYKNRVGENPFFMPIKFPVNIDIDSEEDWNFAITLNKVLKEQNG